MRTAPARLGLWLVTWALACPVVASSAGLEPEPGSFRVARAQSGERKLPAEHACTPPKAGAQEGSGFAVAHELAGGWRLCARGDPGVELDERDGSILEFPEGRSLALATVASGSSRALRITNLGGERRYDWRLDGSSMPFDARARAWMVDALGAVAGLGEIAATRVEAERLQREIDSVRDQERQLRDEIGAILAERGRLQREMGAIRSEERLLRAEIGAVRGDESALRVTLGGHRAAIASLTAQLEHAERSLRGDLEQELERRRASVVELEARLVAENHADRIAALEERLADLRTEERVAGIEARVEALAVDDRVAALEDRSRSLQPRERIAALRRRLNALAPDDRIGRIEQRLEPTLRRLGYTDDVGRASGASTP